MSVHFTNTGNSLRDGYFFELNGERVEGRHFCDIENRVRAMLRKAGMTCTAEEAVAAYMCPRIQEAGWACKGMPVGSRPHILPADALRNSVTAVAGRHVVPFDEIERRIRICLGCQKHTREYCVTCTGHLERIMAMFSGKRPRVPEDSGSGICTCAKAYESAIASVDFKNSESVWEGVPDTCWRKSK